MEGDRRFFNVLEAVRVPIYDLIHAGVKTVVTHVAVNSLRTVIISGEPLNYFAMSKDEWEKERSTHGPGWKPSLNFVLKEDCDEMRLEELLEERWNHVRSIDAYGV